MEPEPQRCSCGSSRCSLEVGPLFRSPTLFLSRSCLRQRLLNPDNERSLLRVRMWWLKCESARDRPPRTPPRELQVLSPSIQSSAPFHVCPHIHIFHILSTCVVVFFFFLVFVFTKLNTGFINPRCYGRCISKSVVTNFISFILIFSFA